MRLRHEVWEHPDDTRSLSQPFEVGYFPTFAAPPAPNVCPNLIGGRPTDAEPRLGLNAAAR